MSDDAFVIRIAREEDLPSIAAILAGDEVGGHGDSADPAMLPSYRAAFARISASPAETLYVVEEAGEVVATFQTLITTTLSGRGTTAMIVETVHTRPDRRGRGIGGRMMAFCIEKARNDGLDRVQLTSNAARLDAHRFYERLGFSRSHVGFKMSLK